MAVAQIFSLDLIVYDLSSHNGTTIMEPTFRSSDLDSTIISKCQLSSSEGFINTFLLRDGDGFRVLTKSSVSQSTLRLEFLREHIQSSNSVVTHSATPSWPENPLDTKFGKFRPVHVLGENNFFDCLSHSPHARSFCSVATNLKNELFGVFAKDLDLYRKLVNARTYASLQTLDFLQYVASGSNARPDQGIIWCTAEALNCGICIFDPYMAYEIFSPSDDDEPQNVIFLGDLGHKFCYLHPLTPEELDEDSSDYHPMKSDRSVLSLPGRLVHRSILYKLHQVLETNISGHYTCTKLKWKSHLSEDKILNSGLPKALIESGLSSRHNWLYFKDFELKLS